MTITKNILVLGEDSTQSSNDTLITTEAKCSVEFTESGKRFALSLHYNASIRFFANSIELYQFKAKDSGIKPYLLGLENI